MASVQHSKAKLNSGAEIPLLGFGTWQDKDEQEEATATALKTGYRHIDTAHVYGTEPQVGRGIKKSGVPRSEIFLTTKLWNNHHDPKDVEKAVDLSLKNLQTDYLDLYLMHWPAAFEPSDELFPKDDNGKIKPSDIDYLDTWKGMEALVKKGKVKAIGVSNFSQSELERLVKNAEIKPAAHQLERHPYLAQKGFMDFHKQHNIHVTQYSPFGNSNPIYDSQIGRIIDDPVLKQIGEKYNKSGAQVALAWGIAWGNSVIPKSKTADRIKSNLEGDFKLEDGDKKEIDEKLDKKMRFNDPSGSFGYKLFADLEGKSSK